MVESLFNAIVEALQAICAATGLTYSEINILIYCGLIPLSWFALVYARRRRGAWLLVVHLLAPAIYYAERKNLTGPSKKFYDENIQALERLVEMSRLSYIVISVIIGVVVPLTIYLLLCFLPKRWLLGFYTFLILGNLVWYAWALYL